MDCEQNYCIYNEDFSCKIHSIKINGYGMCDECVLVPLDNAELQGFKERYFRELDEERFCDY